MHWCENTTVPTFTGVFRSSGSDPLNVEDLKIVLKLPCAAVQRGKFNGPFSTVNPARDPIIGLFQQGYIMWPIAH